MKRKYQVYGIVTGTKYIGEFEANSKEEAEQMAWESEKAEISFCWNCSKDMDDPSISEMVVEEDED